jgi:hypothetical protein
MHFPAPYEAGRAFKPSSRRLVGQSAPGERERFRQEHLEEVAALATPDGIWLDVGVLFTTGVKP